MSQIILDIQKALAYQFKDINILQAALANTDIDIGQAIHSNMSFERAEFLGDRVLGLVIAELLLEKHPDEDEGSIAKRYSALVCRDALVSAGEGINLPEIIRLSKETDHNRYAPLLADTMEALIAAIYCDTGLASAKEMIAKHWHALLEKEIDSAPPSDPKTALQEWCQGRGLPLPKYTLIKTDGAAHAPVFTIEASVNDLQKKTATGYSKKEAEQKAAAVLLKETKL
ncbi:MAG: ribonuclease III [Alphaproteobacteria bacterium]